MVRKTTFDRPPTRYLNPEPFRWTESKDRSPTNCQQRRSNQTFVFSYPYKCCLLDLTRSFQGNNYERTFTNGSPHRTHQRTITLHVLLITRKLQTGSSKVEYIRNGCQRVHFSGSMENVRPVSLPSRYPLMASCNVAGSGKSVLWFVDSQLFPLEVTDIPCQFDGHPRYRDHVQSWKCINGVFLF